MCDKITPDVLIQKLETTNIGIHRYLEKKNDHSLFCFMEGKHDSDYYLGIIRSICGDDCKTIVCGNKSNVLDVYNRVYDRDHDRYRLSFFIDKDYDEPINNPNIFETECYSIENYYCSLDAFKRILKHGLDIPEDADYWQDVIDFFLVQYGQFHHTVDLFNAFYSLLHKFERENNVVYKLNLSDSFPSDLATTNVNCCSKTYTLQNMLDKYNIGANVMTQAEVDAECVRLWSLDPFKVFRGKFEKDMLFKLLNHLITDANTNLQSRIIRKKVSKNINGFSFMADFAQYADIPDSLRTYLGKWAKAA